MRCECGKKKADQSGLCVGCNAKRGLRRCRTCKHLLAISLAFGGTSRSCIECTTRTAEYAQEAIQGKLAGLSTREVAEALGMSQSKVSRLQRATGVAGPKIQVTRNWREEESADTIMNVLRFKGTWNGNRFTLTSKDREWLENIRDAIGCSSAIKKWRQSWRLSVSFEKSLKDHLQQQQNWTLS